MHLSKTPEQVCAAEYRSALRCSPADRLKADRLKGAPLLPVPAHSSGQSSGQRVNTINEMAWVCIGAFLADRVVNP